MVATVTAGCGERIRAADMAYHYKSSITGNALADRCTRREMQRMPGYLSNGVVTYEFKCPQIRCQAVAVQCIEKRCQVVQDTLAEMCDPLTL
jgi:hypothetical protein